MKKLLIVISSMVMGGAEIQTLELANGLLDCDFSIDIVVLNNQKQSIHKADPRIKFHFMDRKSYLDWQVVGKIADLVNQLDPNLIMYVDLFPGIYLSMAKRRFKRKHKMIVVLHSTLPRDTKEKFQRMYLTPMIRSLDKVVYVSKKQQEYWTDNYHYKNVPSVYVHNGIDVERFENYLIPSREKNENWQKTGFEIDDIVIGNCSRFRIEKNHKDLIQSVYQLKQKGYPVKLLLIGDGEMRGEIEEQIKTLEMESDVFITGAQEDVRQFLGLVDIFVLSSKSIETLSIAAIEAMSMRKALVLSDIGGASEIVSVGENGYLYPAEKQEELTEKIEQIIQSKSWKTMGEKSLEIAWKMFHRETMIQRYREEFLRTIRIHPVKNYIYRIDDINPAMDWDKFNLMMNLFKKHKVVPLLGLVPDNKDDFLKDYQENEKYYPLLREMIKNKEIDICQHGYQHLYTTEQHSVNQILYGKVSTSEFVGLSYEKQFEMINKGKEILEKQNLGEIDIWMAPSHTNDDNTLKALKNNGFRYITDGVAVYPFKRKGLKMIPQQIFSPRKVFPFGLYTVCLHFFDLNDELIEEIKDHLQGQDNIISYRDSLEIKPRWFHPWANALYKANRIAYYHGVRRYRNFRKHGFNQKKEKE